jgi:transcriptional regulator with XRE-family HTH domain
MTIGERIRDRRKELNMSQEDLAEKVNRSPQVISNWERNYTLSIPHDDLVALSKALKKSVEFLVGTLNDASEENKDDNDDILPEDWQKQLGFIRRSGSKYLTPEEKEDLLELGKMFAKKIERRLQQEKKEGK